MSAIRVHNLGKRYRLGLTHARSLNELAARWTGRLRGQSVEQAGLDATDSGRTTGGDFWALQDINFEVAPGEVVGIIGRNGAGKSTLLKILSRVTRPTTGQVDLHGRVGSLLEVGTGFHPELTGRENVYMNGTLLGMTKREVARRFDEIVDFAGVERFIDTPVKRYSSGMKVRLGFAVAAHLEPEILIVDEVLAVGDAEFQRKCLGKMSDVAACGRTILFVSHNMSSVRTLCGRGIILSSGGIVTDDLTEIAVQSYLENYGLDEPSEIQYPIVHEHSGLTLNSCDIISDEVTGDLHVRFAMAANYPLRSIGVGLAVKASDGTLVSKIAPRSTNFIIETLHGNTTTELTLHGFSRRLPRGTYNLSLWIALHQRQFLISLDRVASIEVIGVPAAEGGIAPQVITDGYAVLPSSFHVEAGV